MTKASKLTGVAALVTMMVISGATAAVLPGAAAPHKAQKPVASSPVGDDYNWCDKENGTQSDC